MQTDDATRRRCRGRAPVTRLGRVSDRGCVERLHLRWPVDAGWALRPQRRVLRGTGLFQQVHPGAPARHEVRPARARKPEGRVLQLFVEIFGQVDLNTGHTPNHTPTFSAYQQALSIAQTALDRHFFLTVTRSELRRTPSQLRNLNRDGPRPATPRLSMRREGPLFVPLTDRLRQRLCGARYGLKSNTNDVPVVGLPSA